jgi:hypothetical protein
MDKTQQRNTTEHVWLCSWASSDLFPFFFMLSYNATYRPGKKFKTEEFFLNALTPCPSKL